MSTATSYIGHTSKNLIPCKTIQSSRTSSFGTIPTPKFRTNTTHSTTRPASRTHQVYSHSEPPTCYMHVHQQLSQTSRTREPLSLREVKHPHTGMTYMNRSPLTEQAVLSQFSGDSGETGHFTRDPCISQLKSSFQPAIHAPNNQVVTTCINCEHSHRMEHANNFPTHTEMRMDDHLTQNKPAFLGKQFLQGKEEITCTDMNQGNETNMDTRAFIPGSTLSKHSMISTSTHPRTVPQNFQQLEKESTNTMALPGFKHNAETATHVETSCNMHSNGTLSNSLQADTNMYTNMDTNHTAHRYRHTRKEVHLLSEPSEL